MAKVFRQDPFPSRIVGLLATWPTFYAKPGRAGFPTRPSLTLFFLLVGAFLLTLLPHVGQFPLWISTTVIAAMVVRCVVEFYRLPLPSTAFCSLLALCLLAGIVLQFNTMFGREAGTAFTAGLMAIKFYELRGPRDIALIIFSSFFMVMSALLYSQEIELFIYCLIMMWVLTALLMRIQVGDLPEDRLLRMLRQAAIIFLQALPLTVFLFFFFPRFQGKLQISLNDSPIGLTDRVEPGSIARLAQDDSPAMYVKFSGDGAIPTVPSMYWRALTLWTYTKGVWTAGDAPERPQPLASSGVKPIIQEITIYPHNQRWLFALDYPISKPVNPLAEPYWAMAVMGDTLRLREPRGQIDHRERYTVTSSFELAPQTLSNDDRFAGTRLPGDLARDTETIDPQVRTLADRLRRENPDDQAYVSAVLHYFRSEKFVYSASPGETEPGQDWLPHFLFKTKIGFCEHYASAFGVLMRLEKIPTRLVVGYQGADYNPYSNTYIVSQSNAHAWDEVWIEAKKSWVRVDPTTILTEGETAQSGPDTAQQNGPKEDLSFQVAHHRFAIQHGGDA